jgi:AraC-like DNA-binding protein
MKTPDTRRISANTKIDANVLVQLFSTLPDVVFFIKDKLGRYTHVNDSLMRRLDAKMPGEIIGRTAAEAFEEDAGEVYNEQDRQILLRGEPLIDHLELHRYPNQEPGWCLTCKYPLVEDGNIVGIIGISRDLARPNANDPIYKQLSHAIERMHKDYQQEIKLRDLAKECKLSVAQFARHMERVFGVSPKQLLMKIRLDAAMRLLDTPQSIAEVANGSGYADHSAFSRQFKSMTNLTPMQYRHRNRNRR